MSLLFFFDTHPEKGLFLMCDIWESRFCSLLYLPTLGPLIKTWNVRLWLIYYASFTYALFSCCIFLLSPVSDVHLWRAGHDEYRALRVSKCLWTWSSGRNEFVRLFGTPLMSISMSPRQKFREAFFVSKVASRQQSVQCVWFLRFVKFTWVQPYWSYLWLSVWASLSWGIGLHEMKSGYFEWWRAMRRSKTRYQFALVTLKELSVAPTDPSTILGLP